jgi:hypothetical protein
MARPAPILAALIERSGAGETARPSYLDPELDASIIPPEDFLCPG